MDLDAARLGGEAEVARERRAWQQGGSARLNKGAKRIRSELKLTGSKRMKGRD